MAIEYSQKWDLYIETDSVDPPEGVPAADIYAYASFRSLEHVRYGLMRTTGGPFDEEIDSVDVGSYGMEPLAPFWQLGDALDEIERGSKYAFEEVPFVDVESESQFNEALDALGLSRDDDFVTTWEGPGLYDFRDDPPTFQGTAEDYEMDEVEHAADDAIEFMFQGDEWEDAYRQLVEEEEE
jgi:hypothetical protein